MNINLVNQSKQGLGGGWTFLRTFEKYLRKQGVNVTDTFSSEIVFISGATMVKRDDVTRWKREGKKIVLRVDNIPRNSRNRGAGTPRLYDFAQMADLVIYQSEWARDYIMPFIKKDGPVILNGADTDIFKTDGEARPREGTPQYLYARFSRDETKMWEIAWYDYIRIQRLFVNANLWIVGQFSPEVTQYNFDFFMNEKFQYLGIQDDPEDMAEIYRGTDVLIIPYFNDGCSQTLIEARNCGVKGYGFGLTGKTGGAPEIMAAPLEVLSAEYMTKKYVEEIKKI